MDDKERLAIMVKFKEILKKVGRSNAGAYCPYTLINKVPENKICRKLCGHIWPELKSFPDWTYCPCCHFGHKGALKKLDEYIKAHKNDRAQQPRSRSNRNQKDPDQKAKRVHRG